MMIMSKFFILIFATCIQLHEKITKHTQTTTTRKFISDNNLNKTTKKFINCIKIKSERRFLG